MALEKILPQAEQEEYRVIDYADCTPYSHPVSEMVNLGIVWAVKTPIFGKKAEKVAESLKNSDLGSRVIDSTDHAASILINAVRKVREKTPESHQLGKNYDHTATKAYRAAIEAYHELRQQLGLAIHGWYVEAGSKFEPNSVFHPESPADIIYDYSKHLDQPELRRYNPKTNEYKIRPIPTLATT